MNRIFVEDSNYLLNRIALQNMNNMRVLITGSSGLIGKNILNFFDHILKSGNFMFEVDALSKHYEQEAGQYHQNIHFQSGDLNSGLERFSLKKYDLIIHAATYAQPAKFIAQAPETLYLNGPILLELLKHLQDGGTFLFLSTSEIYSGSNSSSNTELDIGRIPIQSPRSAYIYGKIFGEVTLLQLKEEFRIRIGRVALSYGPGTKLKDSRVLNQLISRGLNEHRVELADAGNAFRTYCYVRDTLEMLLKVAFLGESEIYNIGGDSSLTIRELGSEIARILEVPFSFPSEIESYLEAPNRVKIDISKYENEFGPMHFINISDGLKKTIEWQKEMLFR